MRTTTKGAAATGLMTAEEIIARGQNSSTPFLMKVLEKTVTDVLIIPASYIIEDEETHAIQAVHLMAHALKGAKLDKKQLNLSNSFMPTESLPEEVKPALGLLRNLSTMLFTTKYRAEETKEIVAAKSNTSKYKKAVDEDEIISIREKVRLAYFGDYDEDAKKFNTSPKYRPLIDKIKQVVSTFFVVVPLEGDTAIPALDKAVLVTHELTGTQLEKFKKLFKELNANAAELAFVNAYEMPIFKLKRASATDEKEALRDFDLSVYSVETSKLNPALIKGKAEKTKLEEQLTHIRENMLPTTFEALKEMSPINKSSLSPSQVLTAVQSLIRNPQKDWYGAILEFLGSANTEEDPINYFSEDDKFTVLALYKLCSANIIPRNGDIKQTDINLAFGQEKTVLYKFLEAHDLVKDIEVDKPEAGLEGSSGQDEKGGIENVDTSLMDNDDDAPVDDEEGDPDATKEKSKDAVASEI